jgi:hypothetical protein
MNIDEEIQKLEQKKQEDAKKLEEKINALKATKKENETNPEKIIQRLEENGLVSDINITYTLKIPTIEAFQTLNNRYNKFITTNDMLSLRLFNVIANPNAIHKAQITSELGYPAVLSVAQECQFILEDKSQPLLSTATKNHCKQMIGAIMSMILSINSYRKTGKKKSVPHELFKIGELYKKINSNN